MRQKLPWAKVIAGISVLAVIGLGFLIFYDQRKADEAISSPAHPSTQPGQTKELLVYCAAGIRKPVEAAAADYLKEYNVRVQPQYGGSETLLANIRLSHNGDLFIPADDSYIESARKQQLAAETIPLAEMTPVVIVKAGNPKAIHALSDLMRSDVSISLANPDAAAVGKVTRDALSPANEYEPLQAHATVVKATVSEVGTDVKVGSVDAGIVWDATAKQLGAAVEAIHLPELDKAVGHVSVCLLTTSPDEHVQAALRFARYLGARDKGLIHFTQSGFRAVAGDEWAEIPHLLMYSGAMLRPAIDQTVTDFEKREGCRIDRVYNGCGILVGQMKIGQRPDAYFSCDRGFMAQVKDLFTDEINVSMNQLVILVPKGNPHQIKSLFDMGQSGLRIGVGHEKQCALGALTANTLLQSGYYQQVRKNVAVESPTGDLLVNQLLAGSLDVVIAYVSNATGHADQLEAIKIDIPCALAVQPVARGKESRYPNLVNRLCQRLISDESQRRFLANGFRWQLGQPVPLVGLEYSAANPPASQPAAAAAP